VKTSINKPTPARAIKLGRGSRLRTVSAPAFAFGKLVLNGQKQVRMGRLFEAWDSGLGKIPPFLPPKSLVVETNALRVEHSVAMWWGRLARHCGVNVWLFPVWAQAEQSLTLDGTPRSPNCGWRKFWPNDKLAAGERKIRTRGGWIAAWGDWKMMAAFGYAIPDPGKPTTFEVEDSLGFVRQSWKFARWVAARVDEYRRVVASGRSLTVKLYTGETVACGNEEAYVCLRYTPTEAVMRQRMVAYPDLLAKRAGG